ncbi:hypothetical protein BpHYR1_014914 [Brachionus plicatilis]|uniref:Uncharacterized protein n=1 Tax=Brachionus plicatilis TaxID=10195 RepID=A0A3M7RA24_BRAPC|nr:hypothetical protein BpHYR1_014914 [Brachionus plicatilis]
MQKNDRGIYCGDTITLFIFKRKKLKNLKFFYYEQLFYINQNIQTKKTKHVIKKTISIDKNCEYLDLLSYGLIKKKTPRTSLPVNQTFIKKMFNGKIEEKKISKKFSLKKNN